MIPYGWGNLGVWGAMPEASGTSRKVLLEEYRCIFLRVPPSPYRINLALDSRGVNDLLLQVTPSARLPRYVVHGVSRKLGAFVYLETGVQSL